MAEGGGNQNEQNIIPPPNGDRLPIDQQRLAGLTATYGRAAARAFLLGMGVGQERVIVALARAWIVHSLSHYRHLA